MLIFGCHIGPDDVRSDELWHWVMKPDMKEILIFVDVFETIDIVGCFETGVFVSCASQTFLRTAVKQGDSVAFIKRRDIGT